MKIFCIDFALWDLIGPNSMTSNEEIGKAILMDRSVKELSKFYI